MIKFNVETCYDGYIKLELCNNYTVLSTMNIDDDEILKVATAMLKHLDKKEDSNV